MKLEVLTLFIGLTALTAFNSHASVNWHNILQSDYQECKAIYEDILGAKAFQIMEEQQEVLGEVLRFIDRGEWA